MTPLNLRNLSLPRPARRIGLIMLACGVLAFPVLAAFRLMSGEALLTPEAVVVTTQAAFALPAKPAAALERGIPIEFTIEGALLESRSWLPDKIIADWDHARRLQYHALSGRYTLSDPAGDTIESYVTVDEAMQALGQLRGYRFPLTKRKKILPERDYALRLRISLDIESLPALLRPVAYATPSWYVSSGWHEWPARR